MANEWLTYNEYQPKVLGDLPSWVFNNPFQTFETVNKGVEEAYQAAQKSQYDALILENKRRENEAKEQVRRTLGENPDALKGGDVDEVLLGPMARSGDIDSVMKILERRNLDQQRRAQAREQFDYRKQQDAERARERQASEDFRREMLRGGLDLRREIFNDRKENRRAPSDGYTDKVVTVLTPQGTTEPRIVRSVEEELALRQSGYSIVSDDPLAQAIQIQQQLEGRNGGSPTPTPTPGIIGRANDAFQPRNAPSAKRRLRVVPD